MGMTAHRFNRFWSDWDTSQLEQRYIAQLEDALERIMSLGNVVAVYVGGSFVRRELHPLSDIDTWTVVSDRETLERLHALKDDTKPRVSYHGFTIDELRAGKRHDNRGMSSVKRFVADIPQLKLVYGSLNTNEMPIMTAKENLAGRIKGWPSMIESYRAGSMKFSFLAKYFCWIMLTKEQVDGTAIERVLSLRERYPNHIVSRAVSWSREASCDDEERAIEEMDAYVRSIERS